LSNFEGARLQPRRTGLYSCHSERLSGREEFAFHLLVILGAAGPAAEVEGPAFFPSTIHYRLATDFSDVQSSQLPRDLACFRDATDDLLTFA
jgi:hypothetical protein